MPGLSQLTIKPITLSKQARPEPHQARRLYSLMRKRGEGLTVTGESQVVIEKAGAQVEAGGSWAKGKK